MSDDCPPKMKSILLRHLPLFWLGLLLVVILLWAWADSTRIHTMGYYCRDPKRSYSINLTRASVLLVRLSIREIPAANPHSRDLPLTGRWGECSWSPASVGDQGVWFSKPQFEKIGTGYELASLRIPMWLILLCYLPLWFGATRWQGRRKIGKLLAEEQANREAAAG